MTLFPSKAEQQARRKVAIRMGKRTISRYIGECHRMGRKYLEMARKAVGLNDDSASRQYLYQNYLYEQQAEKWARFLLRMEDLTMRGEMSGAMAGLVQSVQALSREIRANVSPRQMAKVVASIQGDMAKLEMAEEQLTEMMACLDLGIGAPIEEGEAAEIPEDVRDQIEHMHAGLRDELAVGEPGGASVSGGADATVDDRLRQGIERLRALKEQRQP
jgi:hypothetical protein